ncbi:MAG TPA: hypothetical protein VF189_06470 [Patescibacteria group bacterium]
MTSPDQRADIATGIGALIGGGSASAAELMQGLPNIEQVGIATVVILAVGAVGALGLRFIERGMEKGLQKFKARRSQAS